MAPARWGLENKAMPKNWGLVVAALGIWLGGCATNGEGTNRDTKTTSADSGGEERLFKGAYRSGRFSGKAPLYDLTVAQVLGEANESFTYKGKPIHPGLVNEFECWLSDLNPVTVSVDVSAAYDSNEYSEETYMSGEYASIETEEGIYGYSRVRTTPDGVHVLKTVCRGEGSGTFESELWVRFEMGQGIYHPEDTPYDQLLMRLVRAK